MKHLGRIIQAARASKGMTQAVLAEEIGASLRTVIAIENERRNPTYDTLFRIINTLNIEPGQIFRPGFSGNTPEQDQFIQEFLDSGTLGQKLAAAASRGIWREMRENKTTN